MTPGILTAIGRRLRLSLAVGAALGLAAACGGGGDTVSSFDPRRLVVFGDEASVLTDAGAKYSVNALEEDDQGNPVVPNQLDCEGNPLWIQELAEEYGFGFAQCPADRPVRATTHAAAGAQVADVKAQIDTFLQSDSFGSRDLVAIYVGANDILDIYTDVTSGSQCRYDNSDPDGSGSAARTARERGEALADQVSRVADGGNGGRVLFVTVPNMGATPFARKQPTASFDPRECLESLTEAFNGGLRANVLQDGRYVGLVALDEQVELILDEPDDWDYDNVSEPACGTQSLTACTTATAVDDFNDFLWADDVRFGPKLHERFGLLAERRADRNPF